MLAFFRKRPQVALAAVTFLWGSTFVVTKDVVRTVAPLPYLAIRFGLAALILIALFPGALRPPRRMLVAAALFATLLVAARVALVALPPGAAPELLRLEARPFHLDLRQSLQVAYMAVVCTVLTFAAQTWAMARMSATRSAVVFALEPAFA